MYLGRLPGILLLGALLAATTVMAQAPLREIDSQVLVDDEGLVEYGGCPADTCIEGFPADGIDLLSLDVREAFIGEKPALCFRISYDLANPSVPNRVVGLSFVVDGSSKQLEFAGLDESQATAAGSELVIGPISYGAGSTVEGWFSQDSLGIQPGATLSEIRLQSRTDSQPDDDMPGPWYSNGVAVPHVPHSADVAEATEEHPPGSYVMKGPAPLLFDVKATPNDVNFPTAWTVTFTNPLSALNQTVMASLAGNWTSSPAVAGSPVLLAPGTSGTMNVTAADLGGSDFGQLILSSDLVTPPWPCRS